MPDLTPGEGADIVVTSNIREVMARLKEFDPALARETRRRLRRSGDEAIARMRGVLAQPPPGGGRGESTGARDQAASALTVRVMTGKRQQGVRIVGSREPFAKSYNKRSWRHPVYGNREVWAEQEGRPYFGSVVAQEAPAMREEIAEALQDALDVVASHARVFGTGGGT